MSTALVPVSDLERMAHAVAASKLFGITTADQAMALMLLAQAEGLHPATAARDYHIIEGRPAMKADAMLARYLSSGGKVEWHEHTDTKVSATFTHPAGGTLKIEWTAEMATRAKLSTRVNRDGSPNMWAKYPRQMLRARVISEGVRATNPAVAVGVYTPEEVNDFEEPKKRKEKDMGAAVVVGKELDEAGMTTREQELEQLAKANGKAAVFYLNRAGVKTASEMSELDWTECVAAIKRSIADKAKRAHDLTPADQP